VTTIRELLLITKQYAQLLDWPIKRINHSVKKVLGKCLDVLKKADQ